MYVTDRPFSFSCRVRLTRMFIHQCFGLPLTLIYDLLLVMEFFSRYIYNVPIGTFTTFPINIQNIWNLVA